MTRDLYAKREKLIAQIPVFWSLVFEQAPPDIDEFIQPTDSNVLLTSLKSLSVSRFEIEGEGEGGSKGGDPRSVAIRFEFEDNDYFEDKVLEKKFWYRRDEDGWAGLVSEPVEIKWCEGKDLTEGLLGMAKKVWDQQQAAAASGADKDKKKKPRTEKDFTPEEKALKEKLDGTGIGGMSFFAWFGYCGPRITAEESRIATEKERENRRLRAEGKKVEPKGEDEEEEDEDEDDDEVTEEELEIFPEGDSLAIAISEDLWPSALKYFSKFTQCRGCFSPSEPMPGSRLANDLQLYSSSSRG